MNSDRASQQFFHAYSSSVRREAELLHRDASLRHIFGGPTFVQARVRVENEFRVRLDLIDGRWQAQVEPANTVESEIAACVTMLEKIKLGDRIPTTPGATVNGNIGECLADALDRELESREKSFIEKIEKRYRKFELEGELFDYDLVRLNPQYAFESEEPLQLWTEAPKDILEFWNYIAYEFEKQKVGYPKFMRPVTNTEMVRQALEAWERRQELAQWNSILETGNQASRGPKTISFQLRILLSHKDLRIQWRKGDNHLWELLQSRQQLLEWIEADNKEELHLDSLSALLWQNTKTLLQAAEDLRLSLESVEVLELLSRLLNQPALHERLLTLDEIPLRILDKEEQLYWQLQATNSVEQEEAIEKTTTAALDEDEHAYYNLQLTYADGTEVPYSLRLLPSNPPRYLDDGVALIGPRPIHTETTEVEPKIAIPKAIARAQKGLDWLESINAKIAPNLDFNITEVPLKLHLQLKIAHDLTRASSEHAALTVEAHCPEGKHREVLELNHWKVIEENPEHEDQVIWYRRGLSAQALDFLDKFGFTWDQSEALFRARVTKNFPERFSEWLEQLPEEIELDLDSTLGSLREDPLLASVRFEVTQGEGDIDWFDLKIIMEVEGLNLSQERLRQLVSARGGFVRGDDGRWLRLQVDLDPEQIELVEKLGLDPFDLSGESHRMHASQLANPEASEIFDPGSWELICSRAKKLELATEEQPPKDLQAELRPYQLDGFRFLCYLTRNQFGGILADDMGLGKTVQSLSWLLWLKHHANENKRDPRPSLVIAPKSVLDVWKGESAKFTPALRVLVVRSQDEVDFQNIHENYDLVVLNYAQLRGREQDLKARVWRAIVLDEGQQIKNPDSRAAKAARALNAEHRLVLSGTPIENRLLDLWSIMSFAQPGILGNKTYFKKRFDRRKDPSSANTLTNRLRPFLLRRTKSEVAIDLPPRIEEDIITKMEGAQEQLYQRELKAIQEQLLDNKGEKSMKKNSMAVLQGLMKLRQVCCHPGLVDPELIDASSAKLDSLFYLLNQLREDGHKVLVFSQFVRMLDIIKNRLEEENHHWNMLTGQTKDRRQVIQDFQESKDPNVFLLSLKAGGTGLNLTQASYVILYDPWWNPAVENQAIDRVHRIGQQNNVIAYRLLMRNSIEQKIRLLQARKNELFKGVLGDGGFAGSLDMQDIEYLFSYDKDAEEEALEAMKRKKRTF